MSASPYSTLVHKSAGDSQRRICQVDPSLRVQRGPSKIVPGKVRMQVPTLALILTH